MKKVMENVCFLAESQGNFCQKVRINLIDGKAQVI